MSVVLGTVGLRVHRQEGRRVTTPQHDRDRRVLEFIYDNDEGLDGAASLSGLRELVGEQEAAISGAGLRQQGLIRQAERLSGGYHITADGRSEVESMRSRRSDRGHRRSLCREEFLRWIDRRTTTNPGSRVARENFDGAADLLPFSDEETEAAAGYLAQQGLIESINTAEADHILVWITEKGRECIDKGRGIATFVNEGHHGGQVFHVSGSGNSIATAVGNNNEVTSNLSQFDPELALQFATAVRQATPVLRLPPDAEATLQDIEQKEDVGRAQRATTLLYTFLMGTSTGTLGQVLGTLGANALGIGT